MTPSSTLPSKLCHCAKRSEAFSILESASFKYHRPRYTSLVIIDSRKNVHATIPKGSMGYDQYTVPDDCTCRTYFCCFPLALANTFPWPFVPIISNFFEKKRTQTHPQFLSGLLRAPTTFLEVAVYSTTKRDPLWLSVFT